MEKRTERNKELYARVNACIKEKAKKTSNDDFKSTHSTLQSINPHLFGGEVEETVVEEKKSNNKKRFILSSVAFLIIITIIIVIAVVISYVK